jgi:hypothetical protein
MARDIDDVPDEIEIDIDGRHTGRPRTSGRLLDRAIGRSAPIVTGGQAGRPKSWVNHTL